MRKQLCTALLLIFSVVLAYPQDQRKKADQYLKDRNEVYFKFNISDRSALADLTRIVSIDDVRGNVVHAYANTKQFDQFLKLGYSYEVLTPPSMAVPKEELMPQKQPKKAAGTLTTWNFYPTYEQYVSYMDSFAILHPDICRLIDIGTTVQGRELLAVEISDSVNIKQGEPEVLLTSSMHGDETTGYILMMHLIDSLLSGYGTSPRITNLVNNYEIYINPLANPDGTYHGGNNTVWAATRENANGVDLNRNYPDPKDGQHPDGNAWQPETVAFMAFADSVHLNMSVNFHGGSEVFNYPWDTWNHIPADDLWWQYVGREWADTCHTYGPPGYFTDENNGVVRGIVWYEISGGRQDYHNYFKNDREVTVELSYIKTMYTSQLINYWDYNFRSFFDYIEEASYGINGQITDSVTGQPLSAKVFISGHDVDNSFEYSKLPSGWYYRYLDAGAWDLSYIATGYHTKVVSGINVAHHQATRQDVQLVPLTFGGVGSRTEVREFQVYPNPASGMIRLVLPDGIHGVYHLVVYDMTGKSCLSSDLDIQPNELPSLNMGSLPAGLYQLNLTSGKELLNARVLVK
ncbi:MAG TPA: M14 family zinc carboxypeptidase [Bacteroidales bacterium]|nr:M14 family zinc carboxypeptidase [Bacteroidales bacterium]